MARLLIMLQILMTVNSKCHLRPGFHVWCKGQCKGQCKWGRKFDVRTVPKGGGGREMGQKHKHKKWNFFFYFLALVLYLHFYFLHVWTLQMQIQTQVKASWVWPVCHLEKKMSKIMHQAIVLSLYLVTFLALLCLHFWYICFCITHVNQAWKVTH